MSAAIILAAGAGRRLGGVAKAILRLGDGTNDSSNQTFLAAVRDTAIAAGVRHVIVVVGPPYADQVSREAKRLSLPTVFNADPGRGMASSVALGFEYARDHLADSAGGLLWPVDHPRVTDATVRAVVAATDPAAITIPSFAGRGGHPTGFGRNLWQDLASCLRAPQGARSIVRELEAHHPERVIRIDVSDPGVVADIDTPTDLDTVRTG